jgi:hypothetical protein
MVLNVVRMLGLCAMFFSFSNVDQAMEDHTVRRSPAEPLRALFLHENSMFDMFDSTV